MADTTKFTKVSCDTPTSRCRPPKHLYPLLQKEKAPSPKLRKILPKSLAEALCPKGSQLAHLYGLPKTHKKNMCKQHILSATDTYNYSLAKWLDEKLKPLSLNRFTIKNIFDFSNEIREMDIDPEHILVSYDVVSLFTNVPLMETIEILVDKAFKEIWFNKTYERTLNRTV